MPAPGLDDDLGLLDRVEYLAVEQFIAGPRVGAFDVAVFPGAARLDVSRAGSNGCDPLSHGLRGELSAVVGTNAGRHAAQNKQVAEHIDGVDGVQLSVHAVRRAFTSKLADDVEHAIFPSVVCSVLDKVVGPDMVGIFRPKTEARAVVEPEPPLLWLLVRQLQPLADCPLKCASACHVQRITSQAGLSIG